MRILISGAGIAGTTLAFWLRRFGFSPTLVERAPGPRAGGYVIDFWGSGFAVAERMGLSETIRRAGYDVREVRIVDRHGRQVAGFAADAMARVAGDRYTSLARGDLAAILYDSLGGEIETLFGDGVQALEDTGNGVRVCLTSGIERTFDLVVGADGLHSRVRALAFGPENRFTHDLGYKVAAFEAPAYAPRDELTYVMYTEVGQQVSRFALRGDRTLFLFVYTDPDEALPDAPDAQKAALRRRFGGHGWECDQILERLDAADELYFDNVSQVRMTPWSQGRVALAGDAAACVSFLAGQGSALAMTEAYVLAGELKRADGAAATAFPRYEALLAPLIRRKQASALRFAGVFAPKSQRSLWVRNQIMNLLRVPGVARFSAGRDLADRIELPDY